MSIFNPQLAQKVGTSECIDGMIAFLNTKTIPAFPGATDVSNVYPKLLAYLQTIGLKNLDGSDKLLDNTISKINFMKPAPVKKSKGSASLKEDDTVRPILVKSILSWSKYYDPNTMLVDVSKLRNMLTIKESSLTNATRNSKHLVDSSSFYYRHASDLKTPIHICDDAEIKYIILEHSASIKILEKKGISRDLTDYQLGGDFQIHRQICAVCWLCNKDIHIYRLYDITKHIYIESFNTACGDDEHVFPPGIGNLLGTLESDKNLTDKLLRDSDYAKFGLESSHSKENTCKSDMVFVNYDTKTGKLEINQKKVDEYLKKLLEWLRTGNGSYPSYELQFSKSYSPMPHEATIAEMKTAVIKYLTQFINIFNAISFTPNPLTDPQYNNKLMLKIRVIYYGCSILNVTIKNFDESWGIYSKFSKNFTSKGGAKSNRMIGGTIDQAIDEIMNFDINLANNSISIPEVCLTGYNNVIGKDKSTQLIGLSSNISKIDDLLQAAEDAANFKETPTGDFNEWITKHPEWLATDIGFEWLTQHIGWLSTNQGLGWLTTEYSIRFRKSDNFNTWLATSDSDRWLKTDEYCYPWTMTQGGLFWINAPTNPWLQYQTDLFAQDIGWFNSEYCYPWTTTNNGLAWINTNGNPWFSRRNGQNWLGTFHCYPWLETLQGMQWLDNHANSFKWAGSETGLKWLISNTGKQWLDAKLGAWQETTEFFPWLETAQGLEWLQSNMGWFQQYNQHWLTTKYCYPWLETEIGLGWVNSNGGSWLSTIHCYPWFATDSGLRWIQTHQSWIDTAIGRQWLTTEYCYRWMAQLSQIPVQLIQSDHFINFVNSPSGHGWLMTTFGQQWLNAPGNMWKNSPNCIDWITDNEYYEWFITDIGFEWLNTKSGKDFLATYIDEFTKTQYCYRWLNQNDDGKRWLTQNINTWIMTQDCYPWFATNTGLEWVCQNLNWINTEIGQNWLNTQYGYRWLLDPEFQQCSQQYMAQEIAKLPNGWLGSDSFRQFLGSPSGHTWITTAIGQQWFRSEFGQQWLQHADCFPWISSETGLQFLSNNMAWIGNTIGSQWLNTEFCYPFLQMDAGLELLQTAIGEQWIQLYGNEFATTSYSYRWFTTSTGTAWLSNEWIKFGQLQPSWFKTESFYKWLTSSFGQQWIVTPSGRQWLTSSFGRQWFATPIGQQWVSTLPPQNQQILRQHLSGGKLLCHLPNKRSTRHNHHKYSSFSTRKQRKSSTRSIKPIKSSNKVYKRTYTRRKVSNTHKNRKYKSHHIYRIRSKHQSKHRPKRRSTHKNKHN